MVNSTPPPLLTMIATDLALYRTLSLRLFTQEQINKSPWVDKFKEAMELLDEIAAGEIPLEVDGEIVDANAANLKIASNTQGYVPTFAEDDAMQQQVDPDKLDDIDADRA